MNTLFLKRYRLVTWSLFLLAATWSLWMGLRHRLLPSSKRAVFVMHSPLGSNQGSSKAFDAAFKLDLFAAKSLHEELQSAYPAPRLVPMTAKDEQDRQADLLPLEKSHDAEEEKQIFTSPMQRRSSKVLRPSSHWSCLDFLVQEP